MIARRAVMLAVLVLASAIATSPPLPAQGIRITGVTTARYVELRPLAADSVPLDATIDSGTFRRTADGIVVRCDEGARFCTYRRSASRVGTVPFLQDLEVSAWGFGAGVSARAQLRSRATLGGRTDLWPRTDDAFDALAAYVEIDRERLRARLGRQWATSGLGFFNFDGASLLVRPRSFATVEVYGGWSLTQGLSESRTAGAIAALENLAPDKRGVLVGAAARIRPDRRGALRAEYQREIRTDRAALYAERLSLDGHWRLALGGVDARLTYDLATGVFNDALARASVRLARHYQLVAELRHYQPYFELWTIWGAFSPVGFREARVTTTMGTDADRLTLAAHASYRRYGEADAGVGFLPIRSDGWRLGADASWRVREHWLAHGGYRADVGFGASRSDGTAGVRWTPNDRAFVGVQGSAFQSVYEFRVGTGRVFGLGADGGVRVRPDLELLADLALYRHTGRNAPQLLDWNQRRATLWLEWSVGRDPGATVSPSRAP